MAQHLFDGILFLLSILSILCVCVYSAPAEPESETGSGSNGEVDESAVQRYLDDLEVRYSASCANQMESKWNYLTNVKTETSQKSEEATAQFVEFQAVTQKEIKEKFPDFSKYSPSIRRELKLLSLNGPGNLTKENSELIIKMQTKMESAYATSKVCKYEESEEPDCKRVVSLQPGITERLRNSRDFAELAYYWSAWYDTMNKAVSTDEYKKFIDLQNELGRANGFANMADMWAAGFEDGSPDYNLKKFKKDMLEIWEELRPYYNKLHAYVRMKLRDDKDHPNLYPKEFQKDGYLPANILGNLWAQDWSSLDARTKPYPSAPSLDATAAMIKKNYTAKKMFQIADEFFQDLGLLKLTDTFWEKSVIEKPTDREVMCHAWAQESCKGKGNTDFRIKMCTKVDQANLVTVHHELGHIQYYMHYTDGHFVFRDGANPGFHEAIGDALALSVSTPRHLQCHLELDLGLAIDCQNSSHSSEVSETDINFLYFQALGKFVYFPFAISVDYWRWGVSEGSIPEEEYNQRWWEIIKNNQGILPPIDRNVEKLAKGLDPSAKFHINANIDYIRYFIAYILQFQFYEAMCIAAGEYHPNDPNTKPLYQCDFSGSKEAGQKLGEMLKLGAKDYWPKSLEVLTGSRKMSTKSVLNYFKPLFDYIDKELEKNKEVPGFGHRDTWTHDGVAT